MLKKLVVTIVRSEVSAVVRVGGSVNVRTVDAEVFRGGRAVIAAGGFSIARQLLARPLDLTVKARTVLFAEVAQADLPRFAGMPSLIGSALEQDESYYLLPPIRYPDGKHYIKIGGDPSDINIGSEPEVRAWFREGPINPPPTIWRVCCRAPCRPLRPLRCDGARVSPPSPAMAIPISVLPTRIVLRF